MSTPKKSKRPAKANALAALPLRVAVAVVNASDWLKLPRHAVEAFLKKLDAVDIRVGSIARGPSRDELTLAKLAHAAGCNVYCHGWVGVRSRAASGPMMGASIADAGSGAVQGVQAATCAAQLGAMLFSVNAERDVWRGPVIEGKKTANPDAVDYLAAFVDGFTRAQPTIGVGYVGLAVPAWHYGSTDQDGDGDIDSAIPAELRARFDQLGVMAYQSTLTALKSGLARADGLWPEHAKKGDLMPWVGVGRIDEGNRPVGNAEASIAIARARRSVCFYVGFGAIGQVFAGNGQHRSIASIIDELKPEACA